MYQIGLADGRMNKQVGDDLLRLILWPHWPTTACCPYEASGGPYSMERVQPALLVEPPQLVRCVRLPEGLHTMKLSVRNAVLAGWLLSFVGCQSAPAPAATGHPGPETIGTTVSRLTAEATRCHRCSRRAGRWNTLRRWLSLS